MIQTSSFRVIKQLWSCDNVLFVHLKIKKSGISFITDNYVFKYISFKTIQTEKYILVTMLNIIWDSKVFISWVILKLIMCIFYTRPELYTFKYRIQKKKKKEHKSAYFCVFILIFWTQTIIFITFYIWFYFLNGFPLKMQ